MALAAGFLPLALEFQARGEDQWLRCDGFEAPDFPAYLARLCDDDHSSERQTYWVTPEDSQEVLAVTSLQTRLPAEEAAWRGHIDFRVRPSRRRRGIGTQALGLTLARAAQGGLRSVLVVCLQDNLPARRVIHRHGGQHVDDAMLAGLTLQQFEVPASPASVA